MLHKKATAAAVLHWTDRPTVKDLYLKPTAQLIKKFNTFVKP